VTFEFRTERPVLDFIATLAERGTTDEERLRSPTDLVSWIAQSRLVDTKVEVRPEQLAQTRLLREAMFGLLTALTDGRHPVSSDREAVNAAAARPLPVLRLRKNGRLSRTGELASVLAALAADCLDLFDSPDRENLRWCDDPRCTRAYIDRSRGRRRRWCGMKGCGDRAKAAAYRQRKREDAES
jgi:predicted RNA-binding Zn ribbon-like protein